MRVGTPDQTGDRSALDSGGGPDRRFDGRAGPNRIGSLAEEQRSAYERLWAALDHFLVELVPAASGG